MNIKKLPLKPSQKLQNVVLNHRNKRQERMIFHCVWDRMAPTEKKERFAKVVCTACERSFLMEWIAGEEPCHQCYAYAHGGRGFFMPNGDPIYHNDTTLCPACGAGVTAIHTSAFGASEIVLEDYYPMEFYKIDGECAAVSFRMIRCADKDGKTHWETSPYEAYYTEGKILKKAVGWYKYFTTVTHMDHWEERRYAYDSYGKADHAVLPAQEITDGTPLENAKLQEYLRSERMRYPISYIKFYLKNKKIENLVTAGASDLLTGLMADEINHYYFSGKLLTLPLIRWKERQPSKMLAMNRQELREFLASIPPLKQAAEYQKWLELKKGPKATIRKLVACGSIDAGDVGLFIQKGIDPERVARYLEKQRRKYPKDHISTRELFDYWRFAEELGEVLQTDGERFPQRLQATHDQYSKAVEDKKTADMNKKISERLTVLTAFAWEKDGFLIRPPASSEEFRAEGKALSHCVATYTERHARGDTAIFFIRRVSAPNKPFYTLELNERTLSVVQNRGKCNCARTEEVCAFEAEWLKHIKEVKKKEKKNGKSNRNTKRAAARAAA